MECYVGLDVSLKQTSICVVNEKGLVVREGVVDSVPEAIAGFVRSKAPGAVRVGLETGPTATWLWTELARLDLPVICIDARHAKAVLKMQVNKNDRNDAAGIARIMQTGWFKEVRVKDLDSHAVKALLASRALLVKIKSDLENQVRGLLKNFGLVVGHGTFNVFAVRAKELIADRPELTSAVSPLLTARTAIEQQIGELDRQVLKLSRQDAQARRFMTLPGIGTDHRAVLQSDDRRSGALQAIEKCRRLYWINDQASCIWRARLVRSNIQVWRRHAPHVSVRGGRRTADPRTEMVGAEGLGHEAHQTQRAAQSQGCRRAQARSHPAPHVGRRDRVQLVEQQGGCCLMSITRS